MNTQDEAKTVVKPELKEEVALKLSIRILRLWKCNDQQVESILGLPSKTVSNKDIGDVNLTPEQLNRASYVANIHATLKSLFSNEDNIYGFMSMKNHNEIFNGKAPIEVIESGSLHELKNTFEHIVNLKIV